MYAVLKTGGKQYKVSQGDVFYVEKLEAEVDSNVEYTIIYTEENHQALG